MTKIPYELVVIEADRLINRMAVSTYDSYRYLLTYLNYINACGWSEKSFDEETLKRIDLAWNQVLRNKII